MTDHLDETRGARIDHRAFLKVGLALPILGAPRAHQIGSQVNWRTFLIKVQVELPEGAAGSVWLLMAIDRATPYQRTLDQRWTASSETIDAIRDQHSGLSVLHASWPGGEGPRSLALTMKIATRDHAVSMERPSRSVSIDRATRARYLKATRLISLSGKCADLNALFVGLCRAVELPARDLYGLRVAPSRQFKSLGRSGDVSSAQRRAEAFVDEIGWIPVDPADVRKVILEEQPNGQLTLPHVEHARRQLFGGEINCFAFNDAHDVHLPGWSGKPLPFLMYPEAEVDAMRRDSLDPLRFRYQIDSNEVV